MPQIAVTAPIEHAFFFLVVIPENVGCDEMNAAGFHFQQLFLPMQIRETGKMKLPDDGNKRLSVAGHIEVRKSKRFSSGVASRLQGKLAGTDRFVGLSDIEF
ncbi:hypothetical protein D3C81_973710 [compost metagenome]